MTERQGHQLTLDQPAVYEIRVPGVIDFSRLDLAGSMTISLPTSRETTPVTILTVRLDQAALHGLLRRLYSLGLPLISVAWQRQDGPRQEPGRQAGKTHH